MTETAIAADEIVEGVTKIGGAPASHPPLCMGVEIRQKLIDALRDGKRGYAVFRLRLDDCFCAVGVLLDLVNPNAWELDPKKGWFWKFAGEKYKGMPPVAFAPTVQSNSYTIKQIQVINDEGKTHAQVVDWIEANVEPV